MFSSLKLGRGMPVKLLNSCWSIQIWVKIESTITSVDLAGKGWCITQPPSFMPIMQFEHVMSSLNKKVSHINFPDGLAAVSVFIDPYAAHSTVQKKYGPTKHGPINVFVARIADFWWIATGKVPICTLQNLAESTEYVPLPK